jgi:hypothetical protein
LEQGGAHLHLPRRDCLYAVGGDFVGQEEQTAFAVATVEQPAIATMCRVVMVFTDARKAEERRRIAVTLEDRLRTAGRLADEEQTDLLKA